MGSVLNQNFIVIKMSTHTQGWTVYIDHAMFANLTGKFKDESSLSGEDRALLLSGSFLLR